MKDKRKGFTGVEILVVVMIIGVVCVVSIPLVRNLFISANETDAIVSLGKLSAAMEVYRTLYKTFPDNLNNLVIVNPTLSAGPLLSSGAKGGYNFRLEPSTLTRNTYEVIAEPKVSGLTGKRNFRVDNSGNIYGVSGDEAIPGIVTVDPGSGGGQGPLN